MEVFNIITLSISGLFLFVLAGVLRLSNPIKVYFKNSGIKLENDVNLLSEVRGMSTVMLLGGLVVLLGTIVPELIMTSFIVAILLFGGYAIGRLLSIVLDGKPNKMIITGLITEIILTAVNIFGLMQVLL